MLNIYICFCHWPLFNFFYCLSSTFKLKEKNDLCLGACQWLPWAPLVYSSNWKWLNILPTYIKYFNYTVCL